MPGYNATGTSLQKPVLTPGRAITLWDAESIHASPPASAESQQFSLHRNPDFPGAFAIEIAFSANPGAFSLEIQVADTDEDKYYITRQTVTSGLNANFVARIEVLNVVAKFGRLKMASMANNVNYTARVS